MSKPTPITVVWHDGSKKMYFPDLKTAGEFFGSEPSTILRHLNNGTEYRDGWYFRKGGDPRHVPEPEVDTLQE